MTRPEGVTAPGWWRRSRIVAATLIALAIGVSAFTYRFNTLGGALAGFDNDHFVRLTRAEMLLQGEQPLRDFADEELRGAWPALTYEVPAWTQRLGGRTFLPEAYVTATLLAAAHMIVFLLALALSRRWSVAVLCVAVAVATMPKLHNYPKVLMLALGVCALRAVALRPSLARLAAAALVTAVATLFRHDQGVYVAVGVAGALVLRETGRWLAAARNVGIYAALTAVFLLPSAIWVHVYRGIPAYLRDALGTVAVERTRTTLSLPQFDLFAPLAGEAPELVATYYAFWGIPLLALVVSVACVATSTWQRLRPEDRATGVGLAAMAVLVNVFFLRANLEARFGDAAVPIVLLAAWIVGVASAWRSTVARRLATAIPAALLIVTLGAAYVFSDVRLELDTSGLSDSWAKTTRRYHAVRSELGQLPPTVWTDEAAQDTLRAARYIAECTSPSDRLMVTGRYHEIPVYARRRFAAGQPLFELSLFTSEAAQRQAVARLERQSVPIILADAEDFEGGFVSDYPLVARYVAETYRDAGTMAIDGEPRLRVLVTSQRQPIRTEPTLGLPCFR